MTGLVEVTELLVTELTTNVVRASTGADGNPRYDKTGKLPLIWVRLLSDRSRLIVEVWDNLPEMLGAPAMRHAELAEESGRGLEMVDSLSEDWGWESVPGWTGKRVWALLSVRSRLTGQTWMRLATAATISETASSIGTPFFCAPSRYRKETAFAATSSSPASSMNGTFCR